MRACSSLESDPVKESLVADAPVAAIWIIDAVFKDSSISCLVPQISKLFTQPQLFWLSYDHSINYLIWFCSKD